MKRAEIVKGEGEAPVLPTSSGAAYWRNEATPEAKAAQHKALNGPALRASPGDGSGEAPTPTPAASEIREVKLRASILDTRVPDWKEVVLCDDSRLGNPMTYLLGRIYETHALEIVHRINAFDAVTAQPSVSPQGEPEKESHE